MGTATGTSDSCDAEATSMATLGVAGVGLIGGSIAAAARSRGLFRRIIGFGRCRERLHAACQAGLIDDFSTDPGTDCRDVDLFVSCLPVDRIADSIRQAASGMRPGSVLTDAGSIKAGICEAVGPEPAPGVVFIGSHPLAGSERQGFEHADADLFDRRTCVITPSGDEPTDAVERLRAFWSGVGGTVVSLSPIEHDALLARVSHLPHLVAAALSSVPSDDALRFAAGGFRDTTRIAGGDPELWTAIFSANREAIADSLTEFLARCDQFRVALANNDSGTIRELLTTAKVRRDLFAALFNHDTP